MFELPRSASNEQVKYLKRLYRKKTRKNEGKIILEGFRIVLEALRNRVSFQTVFISEDFFSSKEGQTILGQQANFGKLFLLDQKLLQEIADTQNPQGIIAIADQKVCPQFNWGQARTILVLDQVQDPGNMGTMIRTALAAGVDGIITLKGSVEIYNLKVLRATMGAIFTIPIMADIDLVHFKEILKGQRDNFKVISADFSGEKYYYQADYGQQTIIIIGNEANGIRAEVLQLSDLRVKIPLIGQIDSLNAAIAAGVILYKIAENRIRENS